MTTIQVVRLAPSDKWSTGILDALWSGKLWRVPDITYEPVVTRQARRDEPAVVVIPGEEWTRRVHELNGYLERFSRVVLVVVADEGSVFPWDKVVHDDLRLWIQTPRPDVHPREHNGHRVRFFGFGWAHDVPEILAQWAHTPPSRAWFFSGQDNHERRHELVKALRNRSGGLLHVTDGFAKGYPRAKYLREIARSEWIPCPSGPVTPDSFRLYETLEAGRIPYVDDVCPAYDHDYWGYVYGTEGARMLSPVGDWDDELPDDDQAHDGAWAPQVSAWWQAEKRAIAWDMRDDVLGTEHEAGAYSVVITSSAIPSHPSLDILDETIRSVRSELGWDVEIIVAADGWRHGHDVPEDDYHAYLAALTATAEHSWEQVLPVISGTWVHQANMMRHALDLVRTPLVLAMEHDTPLVGSCPWDAFHTVIRSGAVNVIRLSSEATVLEPWRHLYLDETPWSDWSPVVPLLRTVQWSSRPHVADADWYRRMVASTFAPSSRTYTEDVWYGMLTHAYRTRGEAGWREWRVATYAPDGDIKRSTHTDGRAGLDKHDETLVFAYPHRTPAGAPHPTPGTW